MTSSVALLATVLGLSVLSLVMSCGEVLGAMWMRRIGRGAEPAGKRIPPHGQGQATPVIGFLSSRSADESAHLIAAFHRGLAETGYAERQNLAVEYRWADGHYDRLPALAVDLVRKPVAVLVAVGGQPAAVVAAAATLTTPIVACFSADPAAGGLVTSLKRPTGNITGSITSGGTLERKRLGLLHELLPQAATIAALLNANNPHIASQMKEVREAAAAISVQLYILRASTDEEIDTAFESITQQRLPALLVGSDSFFDTRRDKLVSLAARHAVPAMYSFREYTAAGGLMSFGIDLSDVYRHIGVYAGRIVKGAKLSDLPIEEPGKLELAINLKTARALALEVPPMLLTRADVVIN